MNYSFLFFPFTHITDESLEIIMAFFPVIKFLSLNRDFDGEQRLSSQTEQGRLVPVHCSKEQLAGARLYFVNILNGHRFTAVTKEISRCF